MKQDLEELYGRAMRAMALREGKLPQLPAECAPPTPARLCPKLWAEKIKRKRGRIDFIKEMMGSMGRGFYPSTIGRLKLRIERMCEDDGFRFRLRDADVRAAIEEARAEGWVEIIQANERWEERVTVPWA